MVKMVALDGSGNSWLWDRNKFINRKFIMQEMYQNYVEGDASWDVPQVFLSISHNYHITYGPGVPEHSAGNRINALVQYRCLLPRFALIMLLQTGHK